MTTVGVVTYVQQVQERLKQVKQQPGGIEIMEKTNAKVWCNRNARHQTFEVGEQVLVLLPAQKDKLLPSTRKLWI